MRAYPILEAVREESIVRTVPRTILHIDMDAFYASVEVRDDPRLRGKPVLVGGFGHRSVVAAASYEARRFGARSAMPMGQARRLCPEAIVVEPRMDRYAEVSCDVFAIFHRYTPLVEGLSLDEAFLDVTSSQSLFGEAEEIAQKIKDDIQRELRLTASAGVAPSKFVAKIASDLRKPDALVVVKPNEVTGFLAPLPIERMWGVGPKTAPKLRALGISTLGDLAVADVRRVRDVCGEWGEEIITLARGEDERSVIPDREAKSIGAEATYDEDLLDRDSIRETLLAHALRIAQRLTRAGLYARGVCVKLKFADFRIITRRMLLPEPVADTDSIHRAASALLDEWFASESPIAPRIRLTGVSVDHFTTSPNRSLFPDQDREKRTKIESFISTARARFGDDILTRATLLSKRDPERS